MQLSYEEHTQLPCLAWIAEVRRGEDTVRISHGSAVETEVGFFSDGAWDGPYEAGQPEAAQMACGFGGRVSEEGLTICTPSHPFECLYVLDAGDHLLLSPSFAYILERSGRNLSPRHMPYLPRILKSLKGTAHHEWSLPLDNGQSLRAFRMRNVRVIKDLELVSSPKPPPPPFPDFETYQNFLITGLRQLSSNASDPRRKQSYELLATVSSGYDSAACAALAREAGCTEAVTIRSARQVRTSETADALRDCGTEIGSALGLDTIEYERDAYRSKSGHPEAEFVANGDLGQDLVMSCFEDRLPGRLLIVGVHGDSVWGTNPNHPHRSDLVRNSPALASLGEFRMRVGFVWAPLPCFGALNFPDLHRITVSQEMQPWSVGGTYDRPIARRILEERGVNRHLFGQSKRAITVLLNSADRIEACLTPESLASFRAFANERPVNMGFLRRAKYTLGFKLSRVIDFPIRSLNRLMRRAHIKRRVSNPMPLRYRQNPGLPEQLVYWGLEHVRSRYANQ